MIKRVGIGLVALFLFSGCFTPYTQSPIATNFKKVEQNKLRAARHWQVIAQDLAKTLRLKGMKVYVALPKRPSEFERGFYKALVSELVTKGAYVVPKKRQADSILQIETQLDYFHRKLSKPMRVGVLAALGSGVYLLRNANGGQFAAASVVAIEGWNYYNSKFDSISHHELIVHVQVVSKERIVDSETRVYYILDADAPLYQEPLPKPQKPIIEMEG